ncbi:MAG: GNAT family N-acetyltransferase [Micromonosporaceae bacterium]
MEESELARRLRRHLAAWLGRWPATSPLDVVGWPARLRPGWDGQVYPALGIATPDGTVLSVPPAAVPAARGLAGLPLDRLVEALPAIVGPAPGSGALDHGLRRATPTDVPVANLTAYCAVFRWSVRPAPLPDAGVWEPAEDPDVPEWLRPFGGQVLIARDPDTGEVLAGVGIKRHDEYGRELAVGTAPAARGRGLARRLVAQAARRVLDEGGVPTYQHDPANIASARVAQAAGFPDRGWLSFGVEALSPP